jgi:hypothetical protein
MIRSTINTVWDRWANLHPFLRFLLPTVAVAALWLLAAKPVYRVFKAWRVERNLVAARQAVADVRMDVARDLSMSVLQSGSPCIEAFRILEKSTASLADPRHGEFARALMSQPDSSDEDRLTGLRGIAMDVPLGLLGQAWNQLPDSCRLDPRFAVAFAERLLVEGRLGEASSVLLAVPLAARTPAVDQRLIRVLIGSGKRDGYVEAQRLIVGKFSDEVAEVTGWLELLETIPVMSLQEKMLEPVRKVLENAAGGDPARLALMLARMDYAAHFPRREALLEDVVGRWQDRDPVALARFLGDLGLYQLLLETFPVERVGEHPELFPYLLDAMERSGAWEQVIPLLDAHGDHLPRFEDSAHRAVVAAKTSESPARVQRWNAAMEEAKSSLLPTAFLALQRIAREAGMQDEAAEAMVEAIRLGRGPLPLYEDLKPLPSMLAEQGQESTLLEICSIYLSFEAGNPVLLTQYAYLACLNNVVEPQTTLKAMEVLAIGYPKELPLQCVLATAYLCAGQHAKAAETLDRLELDPAKLAPGYQAAFLATQVLNRRIAKDDPSITDFPWKSLRPSERKKFSELIRTAVP